LNKQASRRVPGHHQKDKPPQREHRTRGVTKQCACRRPEPVSSAGSPENQNAPEGNAATLRPTTDAATSIRFRGSKREISFGRILILTKMARADADDLQDIQFLLRQESFTHDHLQTAFGRARVPDVAEIRELFQRAQPKVLGLAGY